MINHRNGQNLPTTRKRTKAQMKSDREKGMREDGLRLAGMQRLMQARWDKRAADLTEAHCRNIADVLRVCSQAWPSIILMLFNADLTTSSMFILSM
jgi:hypothetical protein